MIGVKSGSVIPGTDRGDTQRKLETVSKAGVQLTVNMDRAEHECVFLRDMLRSNNTAENICCLSIREKPLSSTCFSHFIISAIVVYSSDRSPQSARLSLAADPVTKLCVVLSHTSFSNIHPGSLLAQVPSLGDTHCKTFI